MISENIRHAGSYCENPYYYAEFRNITLAKLVYRLRPHVSVNLDTSSTYFVDSCLHRAKIAYYHAAPLNASNHLNPSARLYIQVRLQTLYLCHMKYKRPFVNLHGPCSC